VHDAFKREESMPNKAPNRIRSQDNDDRDERWWENSKLASVPPFDVGTVLQQFPELTGPFWEALNVGVSRKIRQEALRLFRAFLTLPEKCQQIFVLKGIHNMSDREVERILGIHHQTVRRRYVEALRQIREALSSG